MARRSSSSIEQRRSKSSDNICLVKSGTPLSTSDAPFEEVAGPTLTAGGGGNKLEKIWFLEHGAADNNWESSSCTEDDALSSDSDGSSSDMLSNSFAEDGESDVSLTVQMTDKLRSLASSTYIVEKGGRGVASSRAVGKTGSVVPDAEKRAPPEEVESRNSVEVDSGIWESTPPLASAETAAGETAAGFDAGSAEDEDRSSTVAGLRVCDCEELELQVESFTSQLDGQDADADSVETVAPVPDFSLLENAAGDGVAGPTSATPGPAQSSRRAWTICRPVT